MLFHKRLAGSLCVESCAPLRLLVATTAQAPALKVGEKRQRCLRLQNFYSSGLFLCCAACNFSSSSLALAMRRRVALEVGPTSHVSHSFQLPSLPVLPTFPLPQPAIQTAPQFRHSRQVRPHFIRCAAKKLAFLLVHAANSSTHWRHLTSLPHLVR